MLIPKKKTYSPSTHSLTHSPSHSLTHTLIPRPHLLRSDDSDGSDQVIVGHAGILLAQVRVENHFLSNFLSQGDFEILCVGAWGVGVMRAHLSSGKYWTDGDDMSPQLPGRRP